MRSAAGCRDTKTAWSRPSDQLRGSKATWTAESFVNFVGPLAYFAFGRKR
jgi:hypothetical protein